MTGKVIKIFSDFYYVKSGDFIVECKLREFFKKAGISVLVGDNVEIEDYNPVSNQGAISKILDRKNELARPSVANIDIVVLVISLKSPIIEYKQIDRYLAQAIQFGLNLIICVNKSDLLIKEEKEDFKKLYEKLGYKVIFTSATKKTGLDELKKEIAGKTAILSGASGVGKSSIINAFDPELSLKTKKISRKTARGTHTTRHCELFNIDNTTSVLDTPGFSLLKFDNMQPKEVEKFFGEIAEYAYFCKYSDCLHVNEEGCSVLENLDKISQSRYQSYLSILEEARQYKEKIKQQGVKTESKVKTVHNKQILKVSTKKRDDSRKKLKQNLSKYFD
ncbi:MAG: ribosome small subunit-dependent GTPase A [Candidatus Gastranaerophilales bacterium]|nr:ribosome small subunit-dependent GTPase A [Candidatus Gastranaerophilales bacterium]